MNPNDPHDWLLKAERDINLAQLAQIHAPDSSDLICYHCQQAAEKYLKALVVHHRLPLRKTHDLEELLDLLLPAQSKIDDSHFHEAIKIKIYAVGIRYPDPACRRPKRNGCPGSPRRRRIFQKLCQRRFGDLTVSVIPSQ